MQNLLNNEQGLDRSTKAAFFFWAGLAWYLSRVAGIVTDAFPLLGSWRGSYIVLSAGLTALGWLGLIIPSPDTRIFWRW